VDSGTTIRQSLRDQGAAVAELLLSGAEEPVRQLEPWQLVVRARRGHQLDPSGGVYRYTLGMEFHRDRLTWLAYGMLGWFAFLQGSPGLVVPHLRDELHLGYTVAGLHVAAFAFGGALAGMVAAPLERRLGRHAMFWLGATGMAVGTVALTLGRGAGATVAAMLVMGWFGGLLLVSVQSTLADHHGEARAIAFAESNVIASLGYLVVAGALALGAALAVGWRAALLAPVAILPVAFMAGRRQPLGAGAADAEVAPSGRLPRAFWIPAALIFFGTAADWCLSSWGASYVHNATGASVDTAVGVMAAYFAGMVAGRVAGSALTRRASPQRVLAVGIGCALAGVGILWSAGSPTLAAVGLALAGFGNGNLFPMALALAIATAPDRPSLAGGRAVTVAAIAVVVLPLSVGRLADAVGLAAALAVVPLCLFAAGAALAALPRMPRISAD
jgi:predicted MFS family arabinose efflux permease